MHKLFIVVRNAIIGFVAFVCFFTIGIFVMPILLPIALLVRYKTRTRHYKTAVTLFFVAITIGILTMIFVKNIGAAIYGAIAGIIGATGIVYLVLDYIEHRKTHVVRATLT